MLCLLSTNPTSASIYTLYIGPYLIIYLLVMICMLQCHVMQNTKSCLHAIRKPVHEWLLIVYVVDKERLWVGFVSVLALWAMHAYANVGACTESHNKLLASFLRAGGSGCGYL